jgi:hypothetical protein
MQGLGKRYGWSATKTRWVAFVAGFVVALLFLLVVGIARSDGVVVYRQRSRSQLSCPRTDASWMTSTPDAAARAPAGPERSLDRVAAAR